MRVFYLLTKTIFFLFSIFVLLPSYFIGKILYLGSLGTFREETCINIGIIIMICIYVYKIGSFIYFKFMTKTRRKLNDRSAEKFIQRRISEHKESYYAHKGDFNIIDKSYDLYLDTPLKEDVVFNGTLIERKNFLESEIKKVEEAFTKHEKAFYYKDNKVTTYLNNNFLNLTTFKLETYEHDTLEEILPIKFNQLEEFRNRVRFLEKQILKDVSSLNGAYASLMKGLNGEEAVEKTLSLYSNRYKILKNVRFVINGQSSESDMIIICEKGVFVVEVKNYGKEGQEIRIGDDGQWTLKTYKDKRLLNDVNGQNNYHCALNQTLINEELKLIGYTGDFIECESIICIANNDVFINNLSNQVIVIPSNIVNYIKNFNPPNLLSEDIQKKIYQILKDNTLEEKTFDVVGNADRIIQSMKELEPLLELNDNIEYNLKTYLLNVNKRNPNCFHYS